MSKKSSLAAELDPFISPFRIDGSGKFHLKSHKTNEKGGLDKDTAEEILDARTRSGPEGKFTIDFNPQRPAARMRYSIAHEIGHTLFSDCAAAIRNRASGKAAEAASPPRRAQ